MNTTWKKELPVAAIALLPLIYLLIIWNELPAVVPTHWNIKGEIDDYGSKATMIMIPLLLPCLIYVLLLIIPAIDPKGKLSKMGNKLYTFKFLMTTFMSLLAMWILYSTKKQSTGNLNTILIAIGLLFLILGNYFKTIQPNYFVGIRTPWALENEMNWKATHKLAGKLWFAGGLLIMLMGFILRAKTNFIVLMCITAVLVFVPVVYSYLFYRKQKRTFA